MRLTSSLVWCILLVVGGLLIPLWFGLGEIPDLAVQTIPRRTHGGRIGAACPPGQQFRCERAGLRQIDVALAVLGQERSEVELVLREGEQNGQIVRRVRVTLDPALRPRYHAFSFEPVADSSGRWYHFQLEPIGQRAFATFAAWIRFHGIVGRDDAWGDTARSTKVVEGELSSPMNNLRAIAVACESLSTEGGAVELDLFEEGQAEPLRHVELPEPIAVRSGYVFFSFPPIPDSADRTYSFRLSSEGEAQFIGLAGAASIKTFHGLPGSRPGLGGMTLGGVSLPDRDLVIRTWSGESRVSNFKVAANRAGWRLWVGGLCWLATLAALARLFIGLDSRRMAARANSSESDTTP